MSDRTDADTKGSQGPVAAQATTPAMAQYLALKEAHPDCLLFYRMGDFYELFFEDAVTAAGALDITLTARGKHSGAEIPMCGVPYHAADGYLARLIRKGFKVAVCEQMEDPAEAKKRGGKAVVHRDVVRLVTPGTLTEETLLDARAHNYLAAVAEAAGTTALAYLDMSTGDFQVQELERTGLSSALGRVSPGELLVSERMLQIPELFDVFAEYRSVLTPLPTARFDSANAEKRLQAAFAVGDVSGFGSFTRADLAAAGTLIDYIELTQKGKVPQLSPPQKVATGTILEIDHATRRNLELSETLSGERKGSLLAAIDRTVTGPGGRLLKAHLAAPLMTPALITARLDAVSWFCGENDHRQQLRQLLKQTPDMARSLSRLSLDRGGPRDIAAIRDGLEAAMSVAALLDPGTIREGLEHGGLGRQGLGQLPADLVATIRALGNHQTLVERLQRALSADLPFLARDGGFIAPGYAPHLDELRTLRDESRRLILGLEARYREQTGVTTLKIKHNNVIGYYIEVTSAHADKLGLGQSPSHDSPFIHRQTMANAARFTTADLADLETKLSGAADKAVAIEMELFADLRSECLSRGAETRLAASALAALDVMASHAELAIDLNWVRPSIDDGTAFEIKQGRHPVVEAALKKDGGARFVANDCDLSTAGNDEADNDSRLWLLTGPNMAGKSTFLRQNALIAILAQMGSYVPASAARIGVVDRVFSRVGAADDLARGRSTFMVEMVETAAILNQATERSLVILDEIGRGTATYDGLSIAWACVEHLHEVNQCRALFATHYHELTALSSRLSHLSCHTMRVKEWKGDVVFLHEVGTGTADRSYGIHVARLAGLPPVAISRAEEVLTNLETGEKARVPSQLADDLPLFAVTAAKEPPPSAASPREASPADRMLETINPDELTPREALDVLYQLKQAQGE